MEWKGSIEYIRSIITTIIGRRTNTKVSRTRLMGSPMIHNTLATRIVLATADSRSRVGLLAALRSESGFHVVGEAYDQTGLLALRRRLQPDILLLDCALGASLDEALCSWPAV